MANFIIIHGTGGHPNGNWFPWLKAELEKRGHQVHVPLFPTPENQDLKNWLQAFTGYWQYLGPNTTLIGHSLGPAFILSLLEIVDQPIKAAYFIAGFTGLLDNPEFDDLNKSFVTKSFNWTKIKSNCIKFCIINSSNDPYVPIEKGRFLADKLNAEFITLPNSGHINLESGYDRFDFLLKKIEKEVL